MTTDKPRKRKFTDEFKADAVQLVEQSGRTVAQVARELEINESTLLGWVKAYRRAHPDPATAPTPVDAARVARLEAENRRLAEENAFLKKAAVNSTRQRNNASSLSAGVSKSRVFRGLEFNRAATASRSAWVRSFMLTPLGKY
jgi:transposase